MTPPICDDEPIHSPAPWRVARGRSPGTYQVLDRLGRVVCTVDPAADREPPGGLLARLWAAAFQPDRPAHRLDPVALRAAADAVLCAAAVDLVPGIKAVWLDLLHARRAAAARSDGYLLGTLDAITDRLAALTDLGPYGPEPVPLTLTPVAGGAA